MEWGGGGGGGGGGQVRHRSPRNSGFIMLNIVKWININTFNPYCIISKYQPAM